MMEDYEPRADKSTSSTLTVTLIFMVVLVIMAWALKRNAADRTVPGAPAQSAAPALRNGPGGSMGPSIPVDERGQQRFDYQVIDRCELEDDPANDGDTFRVLTPQGSFLFRLYWVQTVQLSGDTPEASREAMDHFHLRTEGELRDLAVQARDFTLNTLRGGRFRIVTRWDREPGDEAYNCFAYAAESASPGAAQNNLSLLLVKNGLALIRPSKYPLPDSPTSKPGDFHNDLLAAQEEAARTRTGGWARQP